jgi:hypothetical protein
MRVLLLLLLLLCVLPIANASLTHADQGLAKEHCLVDLAATKAKFPNAVVNSTGWDCSVLQSGSYYRCQMTTSSVGNAPLGACGYFGSPNQGSGQETDYSFPPANTCSTRADEYAGLQTDTTVCGHGCLYQLAPDATKFRIDTSIKSINAGQGKWHATGAVCVPTSLPKPLTKNSYCTDLEGGHSICLDTSGQKKVCSGVTGRCYKWDTGQSGPATDPARNESFVKSPDATAPGLPTSPPVPRPLESWQPGQSTSVTNTTSNSTTNITNYNNSGTPNTNPSAATPGDGSGNNGEAPGDGTGGDGEEEQGPSVGAGGEDCTAIPVTSYLRDTDHILNKIWLQNWYARCEGHDLDSEGAGDEGIAGEGEYGDDDDQPDLPTYDASHDPMGSARQSKNLSDIELDDSGFLSDGACPTIPTVSVRGTPLPLTLGPFCDLLGSMSGFVMALAYFLSFRFIAAGM